MSSVGIFGNTTGVSRYAKLPIKIPQTSWDILLMIHESEGWNTIYDDLLALNERLEKLNIDDEVIDV